ncbi:MAG: exosortase/archaeosortase family protein [bacterium]|nr:exosortase/archaeosortase family protein [bacterium]
MTNSNRLNIALPLLSLSLVAAVFYQTIRDTALICWNDDDYSHGLILPLVAAYLIRERVNFTQSGVGERKISLLGLLLLFVGVIITLLADASGLLFVSWLALFVCLSGVVLMSFQRSFALQILPPLLLLFMAKPMPDSLIPKLFGPLQAIAAQLSAKTLEMLNVPVFILGNVIEIPGMRLMVEEACSGMRSVMAIVTVAVIVVLSADLGRFTQIAVLFLSIAVAVVLNLVRVVSTGLLAHFVDPKAATDFFHTFSGMVVFVVALLLLYWIGLFIEKLSRKFSGAASRAKGVAEHE